MKENSLVKLLSEKEKAQAGLLYDANGDKKLLEERAKCKEICHEINSLRPSEVEKREQLFRKLLGKTGKSFLIEPPFYCDYGYNISVGENFYANVGCVMLDGAKITFGNNVFIAPQCGFYTAGHPLDVSQRNQGLEYARPICVGNNVWIGAQVCVLPGVSIGDNTIVGAGSVVTHDIPSGVIAAGNPCRILRRIEEKKETETHYK